MASVFRRVLAAIACLILSFTVAGASSSGLAKEGFFESAFRGEYGDTQRNAIIRWEGPITICVKGGYTDSDIETLAVLLFDMAKGVKNLPKMTITTTEEEANVVISFVQKNNMAEAVTGYQEGNIGFVWVNYDNKFVISDAQIAISTDISQKNRIAVIREEIVNMMGLLNDITCTKRSIICQNDKSVSDLGGMDYEMLNLLYSPDMLPGTTKEDAMALIGG